MNEQISKMTAYMLNQMSDEVRNEVYRQLQSKRVKEDVLQFIRDDGISLSMEGVEAVVHAYVYDCRYDCNMSYWGNLQSLIEEIHMDELTGNATERILKEHQQLFLEGNLCVRVNSQRELDALAAVVAHAGIKLQAVVPYNFLEHYITFHPQTRTFVSSKRSPIRFEYEILRFDKLDSPSVAGAKKCLENLKSEYDLTDVELTYDDAFDVMRLIYGRDIDCNFEAAARQVLQNIENVWRTDWKKKLNRNVMHKPDKAPVLYNNRGDITMIKTFQKDYLTRTLGLPDNSEYVISDKVIDNDRWTIDHELLFTDPADGKAYRTFYRTGATELQDEAPWEHDTIVVAEEMELQAIIKKEYMPVGAPIYENDEFLQYLGETAVDGALTLSDVRTALLHFTDEETHTQTLARETEENTPPAPVPSDASQVQETERVFTNFFDCNGKRIYVGDYVEDQSTGHIGTVGWDEAHASYRLMEYENCFIDTSDTDWRVLDDPVQAREIIAREAQAFQKFFEKFKKKMDDIFYLDTETTLLCVGMHPSVSDTFSVNCSDGAALPYRLGDLYDQYKRNREAGNAHPLKDIVNSIEDAYDTHDIEDARDEEEYEEDYEYDE